MENTRRWQVSIITSLILFICSAGIGCFQVYREHVDHSALLMIAGVPAFATGLYVTASRVFPTLIEAPRFQFPLNLTLPVVFCCLLPVSALLLGTPEKGLVLPQAIIGYAQVWLQPIELAIVLFFQVFALSIYAFMCKPVVSE